MKKITFFLLTIIFIATMIFLNIGCKEGTEPADEETIEEVSKEEPLPKKEFEGTTITFAWYPSPDLDGVKELLPDFKNETGINVNIVEIDYYGLFEKMIIDTMSDSSEIDVYGTVTHGVPIIAEMGGIEALNQYFDKYGSPDIEDIIPEVLDYYTVEDQIFALPQYPDVLILFYNKKMLDEAGVEVPTEWSEFRETAKMLEKDTNEDGEIDLWGAVINLAADESLPQNFLHLLYQQKGDWIRGQKGGDLDPMEGTDQYFKPTMNDERGVKALTLLAEMYQQKVYAPASIQYSFFEAAEAFMTGKAALYPGYADQAMMVKGSDSIEADNIEFAPVPSWDGVKGICGGGWGATITSNSKNKEASYLFIKFMYGNIENAKKLAYLGLTPTRVSVLNDPDLNTIFPHYQALANMLPYAKEVPSFAEFPETISMAAPILQQAVNGDLTPKEALDKIANNVLDILTNAGYYE